MSTDERSLRLAQLNDLHNQLVNTEQEHFCPALRWALDQMCPPLDGRNPKRDPRPGDRIKVKGWTRRIIRREGNDLRYVREGQANAHEKACWISTWQAWAANGEVLP